MVSSPILNPFIILYLDNYDTLFRESNVQTEIIFGYFYTERGIQYLRFLLEPLITTILRTYGLLMVCICSSTSL